MIQSNFNPVRMYQKKDGTRIVKPCTPIRETRNDLQYKGTFKNLQEALDSVLFKGRNKGNK